MPGPGEGRTETKHDLVGGAHTAAHCFPRRDTGLDPARALRRSWGLRWGGPACPWQLPGRFGRSWVPGKHRGCWAQDRAFGSVVRCSCRWDAGLARAHRWWLGQAQKRILGAPSEISCAWVPREPLGARPLQPLLAPRCWPVALAAWGNCRPLTNVGIHFGLVPFLFFFFFSSRLSFLGKQRGGRPRGETPTSLCVREHSEVENRGVTRGTTCPPQQNQPSGN